MGRADLKGLCHAGDTLEPQEKPERKGMVSVCRCSSRSGVSRDIKGKGTWLWRERAINGWAALSVEPEKEEEKGEQARGDNPREWNGSDTRIACQPSPRPKDGPGQKEGSSRKIVGGNATLKMRGILGGGKGVHKSNSNLLGGSTGYGKGTKRVSRIGRTGASGVAPRATGGYRIS